MSPTASFFRWLQASGQRGDIRPVAFPVIFFSLLVLAGWLTGIEWLMRPLPGRTPVQPLNALSLLLAGISLHFYARRRFSTAQRIFLPGMLIAGLAIFQAMGFALPDFDTLLFRDLLLLRGVANPGRMSPGMALEFLLYGLAISLPRGSRSGYRWVKRIATCGLIIALGSLVAYAVGVTSSTQLGFTGPVAPYGILNFTLLFFGILLLQRRRNWLHFLISPSAGANVVRSMLGYILAWPLAVGLTVALIDPEFTSPRLDMALALVLVMLILTAFALRFGSRLDHAIAERAEAAAAMRASEARLAGIVASAMDAIITITADQRIVLFNAAAEKLFGCTAQDAIGTSIDRFVPPHARSDHAQYVRRFGATGTTSREMGSLGMLTAIRCDGHEFPIEASISQVVVEDQKLFTVILRDISERVRAEAEIRHLNADLERRVGERTAELALTNEALLRSNQELQQFAHIAAHDLQTPLRSISGFAQLLQLDLKERLGEQESIYLKQLVGNTRRMHALIQDLLAYSQLGSQVRPFEPVDCNELIGEVEAVLAAGIAESGAKIEYEELPVVFGDRIQLLQLFQNLVDNAIKYRSEARPQIHVSAERRQYEAAGTEEWEFAVSDNGIGIDPRHRERIFGVFRRLHTLKDYPGTGIGLSICRRVVEHHGGRIWVDSEAGRGSIFRFTLPARMPAAAQAEISPST